MKLTLLSKKQINSMVLPRKCIGKHWVKGIIGQNAKMTNIICVEAVHTENSDIDNHWVIKSN